MGVDVSTSRLELELESHRRSLTGFCYRMLGSGADAEDAVQETMVRAWRSVDRLGARAALKAWLHRIAANVCFDMLQGRQKRALPMDFSPASTADGALGAMHPESTWIQPIADTRVLPLEADPGAVAEERETLRLAFVAALQHLPPRQRAVLILREVLRWRATEVAELLDMTVAGVNSALQRARATLAALQLDEGAGTVSVAPGQEELLARYVDAFERYDMPALTALLQEEAAFSMPPFPLWVRGPEEIVAFMQGTGAKCEGSRLVSTAANGGPAAGIYNPVGDGTYTPWAIVLLDVEDGRITGLHHFIGAEHFERFDLPPVLRDDAG
ncbi:MAG: polymerase, sigma-24 subunit, subfamily [Solirubrobacterales bacterium]|nr:polymerase, sigma-24 subunit, subfamily [Solirubrobacterales bacterium]